MAIFLKKMKNFGNIFGKNVKFLAIFVSQMAISGGSGPVWLSPPCGEFHLHTDALCRRERGRGDTSRLEFRAFRFNNIDIHILNNV